MGQASSPRATPRLVDAYSRRKNFGSQMAAPWSINPAQAIIESMLMDRPLAGGRPSQSIMDFPPNPAALTKFISRAGRLGPL